MTKTQFPWTEKFTCILLDIIVICGAHIASKKDVIEIWCKVNDMFFLQEDILVYKKVHYNLSLSLRNSPALKFTKLENFVRSEINMLLKLLQR